MEVEVITKYLSELVTAISDCVQPVSDQCLAKGLIPNLVYKRVLESDGISEDKARTLILAVKNSAENNGRCLEILLDILEEQLPSTTKEKLLPEIRKGLTEEANTCTVVVSKPQKYAYPVTIEQIPRKTASLQSTLIDRFENLIKQRERIHLEKERLEEKLKGKMEECDRLKEELRALKNQTEPGDEAVALTQNRLTTCGGEVETLKAKFCQLENILEERDIQMQEERNTIIIMGRNMLEEIKDLRSKLANQDREKTGYAADKLSLRHLNLMILYLTCNHQRPSYWKRLGEELGFSISELETIKRVPQRKIIFRHGWGKILKFSLFFKSDDWYRLEEMLRRWLIQYPGDNRGSTDFPAYSKLQTSLVKIGVGSAARDLPTYNHLTSYHSK